MVGIKKGEPTGQERPEPQVAEDPMEKRFRTGGGRETWIKLEKAVFNNDLATIQELAESRQEIVGTWRDDLGRSLLHYDNNIELVKWLINSYPKLINEADNKGITPLQNSFQYHKYEKVLVLVEAGADYQFLFKAEDKRHRAPFYTILSGKDTHLVALRDKLWPDFLEYEYQRDKAMELVIRLCEIGNEASKYLEQIFTTKEINWQEFQYDRWLKDGSLQKGESPSRLGFWDTVAFNSIGTDNNVLKKGRIFKILQQQGINLDQKLSWTNDQTILGCCPFLRRSGTSVIDDVPKNTELPGYINLSVEYMRPLVELGCDINAQDRDGNTVLHNLFKNKNFEYEDLYAAWGKIILEYGADVNIKNNEGQTPADLLPSGEFDRLLKRARLYMEARRKSKEIEHTRQQIITPPKSGSEPVTDEVDEVIPPQVNLDVPKPVVEDKLVELLPAVEEVQEVETPVLVEEPVQPIPVVKMEAKESDSKEELRRRIRELGESLKEKKLVLLNYKKILREKPWKKGLKKFFKMQDPRDWPADSLCVDVDKAIKKVNELIIEADNPDFRLLRTTNLPNEIITFLASLEGLVEKLENFQYS